MSAIDQINQGGTTYEIVPEIAELFSTTKTYHTGDNVIYEAGWYIFKADKTAGAWDATKVDGPFKVTDQLSNLKEDLSHKANADGSYDTLTAGTAKQILSNLEQTDMVPYNYRTAGGSLEIGDREKLKKIVGGSVAWNQLVENGNFAENYDGWNTSSVTATWDSGIVSIVKGGNSAGGIYRNISVSGVSGHKYLALARLNNTSEVTRGVQIQFNGTAVVTVVQGSGWAVAGGVCEYDSTVSNPDRIYLRIGGAGSFEADWVNVFDLTQMFGSTIADYVYSLETATAGAGVDWLKSYFPKIFDSGYIPYNAGTLEHVSGLSAHKMTGFNQWDEETVLGYYNSVGNWVSSDSNLNSKNPIRVLPNTTYYCKVPTGNNFYVSEFTEAIPSGTPGGSSFIKRVAVANNMFTTSENCRYIHFNVASSYGTTYNHDICINLHWDGERDGEYEPYEEHSYLLDSDVTFRGIPKLDANNNLYYDGDTYESDGTVTRKYGIVDLGTLNWTYYESLDSYPSCFYAELAGKENQSDNYGVCSAYVVSESNAVNLTVARIYLTNDKMLVLSNGSSKPYVYVRNDAYTDAATFKAALSGVYLVYELATPITEEADSYTELQTVSNWGTEEFVTTSLVPVGHETAYQPDLRAKIEVAPESPDIDGLYLVKRENGQNSYVAYLGELPSDPSEDGTYTLKATVSSGTVTKTWEADT